MLQIVSNKRNANRSKKELAGYGSVEALLDGGFCPCLQEYGNTGIHAELVGLSTCTTALTDCLNKLRMCKPYLNVKK